MNALLFEHKQRHFPLALPQSLRETIANDAPTPGSNHETNGHWLSEYNNHVYRNSLFVKGPLLSIISEFSEFITPLNLLKLKIYKNDVKKFMFKKV